MSAAKAAKTLHAQSLELQTRLDEVEEQAIRHGKKVLAKLEERVRGLEGELGTYCIFVLTLIWWWYVLALVHHFALHSLIFIPGIDCNVHIDLYWELLKSLAFLHAMFSEYQAHRIEVWNDTYDMSIPQWKAWRLLKFVVVNQKPQMMKAMFDTDEASRAKQRYGHNEQPSWMA